MAYFSAVNALNHTLGGVLNGLGKQNKSATFSIVGATIELASIYFLVALPGLRIYGYIIGFSFSSLAVLLMQFVTNMQNCKVINRLGRMVSKARARIPAYLFIQILLYIFINVHNKSCTSLSYRPWGYPTYMISLYA